METEKSRRGNILNVILILTSVFSTILVNSSKLILPSRSLSASMIVLSTICCSYTSFRLLPTIIFSTMNSSPFEMYPSRSMS